MILAGDVGGTKVHLALYNFDSGKLKVIREHKYPAHDFASLDEVANDFLSKENLDQRLRSRRPASAVPAPFAMAGSS